MKISKKEENEIINTTVEKFRDVKIITYEYVENFLKSILNGEISYDGMTIDQEKIKEVTNLEMDLKYIIQNSIYHKLCILSNEDIDVLLFLVEDKRSTAKLIMKKMGLDDFTNLEDYLMEAINNFRGDENYNSYLTRYIMAKVRGVPFKFKTDEVIVPKVQVDEIGKKKKKKKKKEKDRYKEIGGSDTDSIESVNREECNESIGEDKDNKDEKDDKEETEKKEDINPYLECINRCRGIVGTGCRDNLVIDAQRVDIVKRMEHIDNILYEMYLFLRLGYINGSYYTKEEISKILGVSILDVINYERDTWEYIRELINSQFNRYENYILSKIMISG